MFLLQRNGTNALQCLQWYWNVHGVGLYCVLRRQADVYELRDGASLSELQCCRWLLGEQITLEICVMKIALVCSLCVVCLTGCRELGYAMQGMGEGMIMSQQMYLMQQQQMQQQMMLNGNTGGGGQGPKPSEQMQGIKCPRCGDTYYGQFTCPSCSAPKY